MSQGPCQVITRPYFKNNKTSEYQSNDDTFSLTQLRGFVSKRNTGVHPRSNFIKHRIRKTHSGLETNRGPLPETTKTFVWAIRIRGRIIPKVQWISHKWLKTQAYIRGNVVLLWYKHNIARQTTCRICWRQSPIGNKKVKDLARNKEMQLESNPREYLPILFVVINIEKSNSGFYIEQPHKSSKENSSKHQHWNNLESQETNFYGYTTKYRNARGN